MIDLVIYCSFIFIIISFLMIKNIISEIFLGVGVLLSLYPVLSEIDSMLTAILIITFLVFEIVSLTDLYRHKKTFNQRRSYKTALIWLSLCLTMGISIIFWAKQKEISSAHSPLFIEEYWWKIILIIALVIYSGMRKEQIVKEGHD